MTEQIIMTVKRFDTLRQRDFENGATLEEIRRGLVLLEKLESFIDKVLEEKND